MKFVVLTFAKSFKLSQLLKRTVYLAKRRVLVLYSQLEIFYLHANKREESGIPVVLAALEIDISKIQKRTTLYAA